MAIDKNADFTPSIPDSDVVPTKLPYNTRGGFKFWAQKVIPLVYDDSLSYYEVLCKVVNYLNNVIQNVDNLNESVNSTNQSFETLKGYVNTTKDTLINTYNELQDYVNTYFDNLDVQEEINAKLDAMADSGELTNLLAPFIPDLVTQWLNQHVTPTSPVVDNTLSISGAAADAKVTGDNFTELKEDISDIDELLFNGPPSETVEINQLTDSVFASLPLTYKWVIGIVPSNATTDPIKIVVQGNSTAIVKLEKWEWNGTVYALSETVTADSVEPYTQASGQHYMLTFSGFTANAKTLLSFSDSSSTGWVRYRSNATGYTAKRFSKNLTTVTEADFLESPNTEILYYLKYTTYAHKTAKYTNIVIVDATGKGDYTTVVDAVATEPEGTVFRIMPGVYEGTVEAFQKRIILIGTDRNQCILKSTDGRYEYPAINGSCGYLENLTLISEYVSGTSHEINSNTSGAYAFHCENAYGIGKTLEFHHCTLISDFFPALGAGLRKDFHLILDDCELRNNQIVGRGAYSNLREGSLGALYFHDANGEQGDQYIIVKNCVMKSTLGTSMTPFQVERETQDNKVYCEFLGNVLYDERHRYANNIWYRGDPFNADSGIFSIEIGYGNSNDDLNNN